MNFPGLVDWSSIRALQMTGAERDLQGNGSAATQIRDEEFWYQDGTVVLVARNVEFRVYGGVLANHSPVFADMFSQHQTSRAPDDPSVCLVVPIEDRPEDLRVVLRAILPKSPDASVVPALPVPSAIH